MSILSKTLSKGAFAVMSVAGLASSVLAQSYGTTYSSTDDAAVGLFGGMFILVYCCLIIFSLAAFGFMVWMLIDVLKRTDAEMPNKTMWILIVLFTGIIGSLVYFFTERKKLNAGKKAATVVKA
jgi:hypothetical protein